MPGNISGDAAILYLSLVIALSKFIRRLYGSIDAIILRLFDHMPNSLNNFRDMRPRLRMQKGRWSAFLHGWRTPKEGSLTGPPPILI